MSYVVYGARGSGSSIVEAACAELAVDYTVRDLDARHGEHRGEAYAAINPRRKMPALQVDGGEVITETVAILVTLDERHRDRGLLPPPGSVARAHALRWMLVLATELYPIVEIMDHPERFTADASGVAAVREQAVHLWLQRWATVEAHCAAAPYFAAEGFSATDLYLTTLSRWDMDPAWRATHLPKVEAVSAAVRGRPRVSEALARHFG